MLHKERKEEKYQINLCKENSCERVRKKKVIRKPTYCHEKLPVMPSLRRSRSERCLLGPGPVSGGSVAFSPLPLPSSMAVLMFEVELDMGAPPPPAPPSLPLTAPPAPTVLTACATCCCCSTCSIMGGCCCVVAICCKLCGSCCCCCCCCCRC